MRPTIPKSALNMLRSDVSEEYGTDKDGDPMQLYQLGGYTSEGEFVRAALREKIERHKGKYLNNND